MAGHKRKQRRSGALPPTPGAELQDSQFSRPGNDETRILASIRQQYWSGPLPSPEALQDYEDVFPGCAERIVGMAERQASHRQELETSRLDGVQRAELIGQVFGLIVALFAIGSSVWLVTAGYQISGIGFLVTSIAGLAAVFVYGQRSQAKELQRKMQEVDQPVPEQIPLFPDGESKDSDGLSPAQE